MDDPPFIVKLLTAMALIGFAIWITLHNQKRKTPPPPLPAAALPEKEAPDISPILTGKSRDFWVSLIFTRVSVDYWEPKGVFCYFDPDDVQRISVFVGIGRGSAGGSYCASMIGERERSWIREFLNETDGSWFLPHLDQFIAAGDMDLPAIARDFQNFYGFPILEYKEFSMSPAFAAFRPRSERKFAERAARWPRR